MVLLVWQGVRWILLRDNRYAGLSKKRKLVKGVRTMVRSSRPVHKKTPAKSECFFGRGRWIRTTEVTESESVALPLGDTPKYLTDIFYQILSFFTSVYAPYFQKNLIFFVFYPFSSSLRGCNFIFYVVEYVKNNGSR